MGESRDEEEVINLIEKEEEKEGEKDRYTKRERQRGRRLIVYLIM